jgi:1,2-diacylglycerol 3-alpha-glucosyltransferase
LRVLMVTDVYFPRVNGVSTSIRTFRRDLAALGCEVDLIAPAYPARWDDDPGVTRVASRYLPCDPEDRAMHLRALARERRAQHGRFNLVHVQTPFLAHHAGLAAARAAGVAIVESYHTLFEEYLHHYVRHAPRSALRFLARRASCVHCNAVDAVIAPSDAMARRLLGYGVATAVEVIPTGLNVEEFHGGDGARFRADIGLQPECPVLLYVGRVAHEKNIGFLLSAMAILRELVPAAVLVIAGDGPARPALERDVLERGLKGRVRFVGYLERGRTLLDCYRSADLFAFASRTETQGLVLLEAMAVGLPVLAQSAMGTESILSHGRGAVVAPDDPAAYAAMAAELLRERERLDELARDARRFVLEHWSSREMARRMLTLYERTIRRRRSGDH